MENNFNPNDVAIKNGNYFSFPYSPEEADVLILPLPWDVTTSYRDGTSKGPQAILEASSQLDFTSPFKERAWETKIGTIPTPKIWMETNNRLRKIAKERISNLERGEVNPQMEENLKIMNNEISQFHKNTKELAQAWLQKGKKIISLGGDHSITWGPIQAIQDEFSVLHIDAHADLRINYEGFPHSHASIMNLVKDLPNVKNIVQVGIRDFSPDEKFLTEKEAKITTFFDHALRQNTARGMHWQLQCKEIVKALNSKNIYISVDIDGLDPKFCPNTGTPVPGGLEIWEFYILLEEVIASGKKCIGADLVEVAPSAFDSANEWDANVGARILFQLCQIIA